MTGAINMKTLNKYFLVITTLGCLTQVSNAAERKVGDFFVDCKTGPGQCSPGGNPSLECTITVEDIVIKTTTLTPLSPRANVDLAINEKHLTGTLSSYFGEP